MQAAHGGHDAYLQFLKLPTLPSPVKVTHNNCFVSHLSRLLIVTRIRATTTWALFACCCQHPLDAALLAMPALLHANQALAAEQGTVNIYLHYTSQVLTSHTTQYCLRVHR